MAPNHERNLIRVEVQGHIEEIVSLLISITNQILERIFQFYDEVHNVQHQIDHDKDNKIKKFGNMKKFHIPLNPPDIFSGNQLALQFAWFLLRVSSSIRLGKKQAAQATFWRRWPQMVIRTDCIFCCCWLQSKLKCMMTLRSNRKNADRNVCRFYPAVTKTMSSAWWKADFFLA